MRYAVFRCAFDLIYIGVTGGIIESRRDPQLRHIHNEAGTVTPDGISRVFRARCLGFKPVNRVYGPDLMRRLTELSRKRVIVSLFHVGGRNCRISRSNIGSRYLTGTMTPPFQPLTPEEDEATVGRIDEVARTLYRLA